MLLLAAGGVLVKPRPLIPSIPASEKIQVLDGRRAFSLQRAATEACGPDVVSYPALAVNLGLMTVVLVLGVALLWRFASVEESQAESTYVADL